MNLRCLFGHDWHNVEVTGTTQVLDLGSLNASLHDHRQCRRCLKIQMFMGESWYTIHKVD